MNFLDVPPIFQPQPHAPGLGPWCQVSEDLDQGSGDWPLAQPCHSLSLGTLTSSLWAPVPSSQKIRRTARGIPRVLFNSGIPGFWFTFGPPAAQYHWQTNGCRKIPRDTQRGLLSCHFGSPLKEKKVSSGDYYQKNYMFNSHHLIHITNLISVGNSPQELIKWATKIFPKISFTHSFFHSSKNIYWVPSGYITH